MILALLYACATRPEKDCETKYLRGPNGDKTVTSCGYGPELKDDNVSIVSSYTTSEKVSARTPEADPGGYPGTRTSYFLTDKQFEVKIAADSEDTYTCDAVVMNNRGLEDATGVEIDPTSCNSTMTDVPFSESGIDVAAAAAKIYALALKYALIR